MNSDLYIHRSGRTARAGQPGQSIILTTKEEYTKEFKKLCKELNNKAFDFPTYQLNLKILKDIIRPAIVTAKQLDELLNKQKKAGLNNKFVKEMQESFDLSDKNVGKHIVDSRTSKADSREMRALKFDMRGGLRNSISSSYVG